jgi:hypothetical protein
MSQRNLCPGGLVEPCLPSPAKAPPGGSDWLHEIKHDGFRLMARRDAKGVRLYPVHCTAYGCFAGPICGARTGLAIP